MTKTKVPAPNTYFLPSTIGTSRHDPTLTQAPGYSFGSRYSYHLASGPGPYFIPGGMSNKGPNTRTGFSLHGKARKSMWVSANADTPGPTLFGGSVTTFRSPPSYSFGSPFKSNHKSPGPGPNSYYPLRPFGSSAKGAIIGGRDKDTFAKTVAKAPGPAAYGNPYSQQSNHGPAFSMGRRVFRPSKKTETPGPGAYMPSPLENSMPSSPRFSMGVRHHEDVLTLKNA